MPPKTVNCIKFFTKYWNINARFFFKFGICGELQWGSVVKIWTISLKGFQSYRGQKLRSFITSKIFSASE